MDSEKKTTRRTNPRKNASILSKITFWYTIDLFKKGFKRELEEQDLYEVLPEFESCSLGDQVEREWEQQKQHKNAMFIIFWKMFGPYYCLLSLNMLFHIMFHVVRPMIMSKLVSLLAPNKKESKTIDIYLYSALLILLLLIGLVCRHNFFFLAENLIIKIRTAISTLVYRKLLRLPASRLRYVSFGNITNLITRDVAAFDQFFLNLSYGWTGLIIIVITCCNMYENIGFPTVMVIVVVVILIPAQVSIGIWISSLKKSTCDAADKRIAIIQDVLSNMRSAKMYVWETYVERRITAVREKETSFYFKVVVALFSSIVIGIAAANVTLYLVLMMYIWLGQQLSSQIIYFITGAFTSLIFNFSVATPYTTFYAAQVTAAVKRMQALVQKLEIQSEPTKPCKEGDARINLKNVTLSADDKVILDNVSFDIDRGLTLVTGPASSGKSFLLMTLLKEFNPSKGDLLVEGNTSYASQEPWLFPSTIKQNILFGSKYNYKRYQDVIKVCDLQYDFDLLENGDSTVVADRGINLSKGQQSRINLARAVYKESDIYLLDDCLSSLDPLVETFIFKNCILNFLRNKLVILVSHNTGLMSYATTVLTLRNGSVQSFMNTFSRKVDCSTEITNLKRKMWSREFETADDCSDEKKLIPTKKTNKIYAENKNVGPVNFKIYQKLLNLGGGTYFLLIILFLYIINQLSVSYKDKLVGEWANVGDQISQVNKSAVNTSHYSLLIQKRNDLTMKFTITVVGICLSAIIRGIALFLFFKTVSVNIHNKMLKNILNASIIFFDCNFIGNIVNRFSKDLVTVDESIPFPIHHLTAIIFETAGSLVIIVSTNVTLLIPVLLLLISFSLLRHVYLKTGRPLKRLDASTRSPIIGYLNATLEGLLSVKVFGAEKILKEEFEKHHNLYNSASFSHSSCLKAFVFAADLCVTIFVAVVIFQFVIFSEGVLPADFGLAISQALIMGTELNFALYKVVELETQMTAVERAIEYTTIKKETNAGVQIENWPKATEIKYENVCLSLDNSKTYLLKNINFCIKSQEKIGIVGRTGAGKSSVVAALFRLYEYEGKITIDNTDIKTLSLSFLRSRMSIIPQDPILLDGTLRDNIDPGRKHKEEEIWRALEAVKFQELMRMLDINIKELNLTCGQKQLICLARVLLSNNKILVLDEIVEGVDSETEKLISDIINANFSSCIIIKIAHNLKFVMDCHKILVMYNGEIVECGGPNSLLKNKTGLFYKMVLNSNIRMVT